MKEKDNFETVTVTAKVAKKDSDGKRVKEIVDGKKVTVFETKEKTIKKDNAEQTARSQTDAEGSVFCYRSSEGSWQVRRRTPRKSI